MEDYGLQISWFFSISWLLVIITNREVKEGEEKFTKGLINLD
jgi:hypothetical protein